MPQTRRLGDDMAILRLVKLTAAAAMVARNIHMLVGREPLQEQGHDPSPATLGQTSEGQWLEVSIEYNGRRMIFPINPSELSITRSVNNHTYEVLELGEVILPNTPGLESISFRSQFWRERSNSESSEYVDWLNEWREEEKPGRLVVVNHNPESDYRGYNKLVLCIDFDTNEGRSGFEDDVYYTLNLKEWREGVEVGEVEVEYDPITEEPYILPPEPNRFCMAELGPLPRTHIARRGDSLFSIPKFYGQPGTAWRELYELPANKRLLGENPHAISVDMVLTIPDTWGEFREQRTTPVPPPPQPPVARPITPTGGSSMGRGDGIHTTR